ncbi:thioredoxin domain-containing protein [Microbulbifer rhizosphaerae]|uniref:Spermatogenesis-associated protein 20-like TRX domain-containing protein n=1 Tax=Microbulbifer rhizosphaerae TaxID=1562603 RepID=A0A7W4WA19_9GAMM|nr:thioredoxin domain-containing protein [Microbulbifer rhizosphaerae]MBB3059888.1 hypothetical protein [Microbulbifer rhizosphaerae]
MSQKPTPSPVALPGAEPQGETLRKDIAAAYRNKGADYRPRTRHLNEDGSARYTNRLFMESSPYLLQHAHNPVNWYPWGEEAFAAAKKLDRPILLSVGYSTCHWCHVMEEESFEDEEIAKAMNEHYIAVKVDREERPDIDAVYMSAVQALTGRGGWPMTVWLTPEGKPFHGDSYIPPRDGDRGARYGYLTLLRQLAEIYHQHPQKVAQSSEGLTRAVKQILAPQTSGELPKAELLQTAVTRYRQVYDPQHGGIEGAPKFPSGLPVRLLLRHYRHSGDEAVLEMATNTLEKMAAGGIHDQVGGGFHRYSTDAQWLVPHFEIMLYDNALLAIAYLEAYQVTGDTLFKTVAEDILRYVKRDMMAPGGAFYSATDADSPTPEGHREEGWFFTWTPAEMDAVLNEEEALLAKSYYQVSEKGNFEGRNILHAPEPLAAVAGELEIPDHRARLLLASIREKLYRARAQRPPPIRDEKILSAWNGLMISAFARAGLVLNEPDYTETAKNAAAFLLENLYEDGRLQRSFMDGRARHNGYLEDYAFTIAAMLDLYEASGELHWLQQALALDETLEKLYEDRKQGGFYMTSDDHEKLLAREKPAFDGAEPSGNSAALLNLLRLHEFTTDDRFRQRAEKGLKAFAGSLQTNPMALSEMMQALAFYRDRAKEIIIVTPEGEKDSAAPMLAELRRTFLPNRVLAVVEQGRELARQTKLIPLLEGKKAQAGKATAYVCEQGVCELPVQDSAIFSRQIRKVEPLWKRD